MSERERFEDFIEQNHRNRSTARHIDSEGVARHYKDPIVQLLWEGWQARARIAEQEKREFVEALEQAIGLQRKHYGYGIDLHIAMIEWAKEARALLAKHES